MNLFLPLLPLAAFSALCSEDCESKTSLCIEYHTCVGGRTVLEFKARCQIKKHLIENCCPVDTSSSGSDDPAAGCSFSQGFHDRWAQQAAISPGILPGGKTSTAAQTNACRSESATKLTKYDCEASYLDKWSAEVAAGNSNTYSGGGYSGGGYSGGGKGEGYSREGREYDSSGNGTRTGTIQVSRNTETGSSSDNNSSNGTRSKTDLISEDDSRSDDHSGGLGQGSACWQVPAIFTVLLSAAVLMPTEIAPQFYASTP